MSRTKGEEKATYRPQVPVPPRPQRPDQSSWPSPTPMPISPMDDAGKTLKQILDRLDAIEKRLENIEKTLMTRHPV